MRGFLPILSLLLVFVSACSASTMTQTSDRVLPQRVAGNVSAAVQYIPIALDSCCVVAVDSRLNRVYVSRTAKATGSNTTVLDGSTYSVITTIGRFGGAHNVDSKTHRFWLPGLFARNVKVYSGRTNSVVGTVTLGACPTDSWIDPARRYAWIAAHCGHHDDPVWAVNADTYKKVSARIGTGGSMQTTVVNPVTGKFYVNNDSGNYEIDPGSFTIAPTSFGVAYAVNPRANLIYTSTKPDVLNIVDGNTDRIVKSIGLGYLPSAIAVNPRLNHIYLADAPENPDFIEVLDGNTLMELASITFPSQWFVRSIASDNRRARIYAGIATPSTGYLFEIRDTAPPGSTLNGENGGRVCAAVCR